MKVFIDTGAFHALANKSDSLHELVVAVYQDIVDQNSSLYTSNYVIDETVTLIRARVSHKAAMVFMNGFDISRIRLLRVTEKDERVAKRIFSTYKDKEFSFTDCTSFALMDRYGINASLSLDKHFSQYGYKHSVKHLLR